MIICNTYGIANQHLTYVYITQLLTPGMYQSMNIFPLLATMVVRLIT